MKALRSVITVVLLVGIVAVAAVLIRRTCPCCASQRVLTLATTTSTENSGLLAYLHPDFEAKTGIKIKVVAKGTGASLQLAREGNADVIMVHARAQEDQFVDEGYGVDRRDVMYNDFVIIGPSNDPAGLSGTVSAAEAFKKIADAGV